MALRDVADLLNVVVDQNAQNGAAIVRRAANQEVAGDLAPTLLEPIDIGLEAAGCRDQRAGANLRCAGLFLHGRGQKHAVLDFEPDDFGIVANLDAELLGGGVKRVQHGAAAAEEE